MAQSCLDQWHKTVLINDIKAVLINDIKAVLINGMKLS